MDIPKDELEADLVHEQKMLKIRRRNLRLLEEQSANFGLDIPLQIKNQITETKEDIQGHEKRIDELQTTLAEGDIPLSEVEYQMHLADVWDITEENPKFAHLYRLDFVRLRLHITAERAKELELEIRRVLATELMYKITRNSEFYAEFHKMIWWMCGNGSLSSAVRLKDPTILLLFWRMLFLDSEIAVDYLMHEIKPFMRKLKVHRVYHLLERIYFLDERDKERLTSYLLSKLGSMDQKAYKEEIMLEVDELFPE